jgi:hypothetical protein
MQVFPPALLNQKTDEDLTSTKVNGLLFFNEKSNRPPQIAENVDAHFSQLSSDILHYCWFFRVRLTLAY